MRECILCYCHNRREAWVGLVVCRVMNKVLV